MRTVRDAINAGVRTIYCNSGLIIDMEDVHMSEYEMMSTVKHINGKRILRWIFCNLGSSFKNRDALDYPGVDDLIKAKRSMLYNTHDFIAREREVNLLIALNKGIDEYQTMYWVTGWIDDYNSTFNGVR